MATWLLDATLRVSLILGLALLADLAFRRRSAAIRHTLWAATMLGALLVPALSHTLPRLPLPLVPVAGRHDRPVDGPVSPATLGASKDAGAMSDSGQLATPALPRDADPKALEADPPPLPPRWSWRDVLLGMWVIGVSLAALRLGVGLTKIARLTRRACPAGGVARAIANELAGKLRLRRPLALAFSDELSTPLTWRCLSPVVLLPTVAKRWSIERLRVVLLHELVHVRQQHWAIHIAARAAAALYWFHPLVWLAMHRLRLERERACDEAVLDHGFKPSDYAAHLVDVARVFTGNGTSLATGLTLASRGNLERRLEMILRRRRPIPTTLLAVVATGFAAVALVATVSAVEPRAFAAATESSEPGSSGSILDAGESHTSRSGYENGDLVFDRRDGDFRLSLRIEESDGVELSADQREIVRLGRRSSVLLRTADGTSRQRLEITSGPNGELRYAWSVDGETRAFDPQAKEWMSLTLEVASGFHEASELRGKESSLRGQISSIRGQRSSLEGQISSIRGQRSSLEGQISSIRGHVSSLRGEISSVRGQLSSLNGRISSLNGRISSLNAQRRSLPSGTSESDEEMRTLSERMNGVLGQQIAEVRQEIATVEAEIEAYDADSRVREVERQIETYDAESRIREAHAQIDELDVDGRVREIEQQIEELDVEGKVEQLEREIDRLDADERAAAIEARTGEKYDELKRLVRRMR